MITGDDRERWRARLTTDIRLVDRKALCGGGAALLILAGLAAAASGLHVVAGAVSTLASVVMADLGLALLALGILAPSERATRPSAGAISAPESERAAAISSSDLAPIESTTAEHVSGRRKAAALALAGLSPADAKLCRELAVFAGRGPVPPSAVEALWASHGKSAEETARLLEELAARAIVGRGNGGAVIVGEEPGALGAGSAAGGKGLAAAHARLVDGYRSLCADRSWSEGPNDGYFFENIAYHMTQANRTAELQRLLLDYDWLRTKLAVCGIIRLVGDFGHGTLPTDVEAVDRALVLSAARLAADPARLAPLLASRLVGEPSPGIARLLQQMRQRAPRPWICPLAPALIPPADSQQPDRLQQPARSLPAEAIAPAEQVRATAEPPMPAPQSSRVVRALAVTADGRRLIAGGDDRTIRIWDLASGRLERTLTGHTDSVRAVAVTPDGRRVVSGGTYDVVRVWDLVSGRFVHTIATQGGFRAVYAIAVTPDGGRVVWGGAGAAVQVWDLAHNRIERTLRSQDPLVRAVAITPDGKFVLSGGDAGIVAIWDLGTGELARALETHARPVYTIAVTPDGSRVVSGGRDNTVQVWDLASGRLEMTLRGHAGPVDAVAVTPDGRRIVSSGQDRKVRVWDLSSGREIASWGPEPESDSNPAAAVMALRPIPADPTRVVYGDSSGRVQVLGLLEA